MLRVFPFSMLSDEVGIPEKTWLGSGQEKNPQTNAVKRSEYPAHRANFMKKQGK